MNGSIELPFLVQCPVSCHMCPVCCASLCLLFICFWCVDNMPLYHTATPTVKSSHLLHVVLGVLLGQQQVFCSFSLVFLVKCIHIPHAMTMILGGHHVLFQFSSFLHPWSTKFHPYQRVSPLSRESPSRLKSTP